MPIKVSAILLAAGISQRMGDQNKLSLMIEGETMFKYVLHELVKSDVDEIVVVSNNDNLSIIPSELVEKYQLILNPDYEMGMTTSIQRGVEAASENSQGYMICMCDQPLLSSEDYNLILTAFTAARELDEACIVVPHYKMIKGNPVVFSAFYRNEILTHTSMNGCKGIVKAHLANRVIVDMNSDAVIRDIDTLEDYKNMPQF